MPATATIRPYDPDDREGFLSLYETVFGHPDADEWFAWKYERNPNVEAPPIVVAERDGRLVGAMPFFVLRMRARGRSLTGRVPGDLMVHPDHRRQGIFSRLSATVNERLRGQDRTVLFGYPNDAALPGWLATGYDRLGTEPAHYRVQDPGSFLAARASLPGLAIVGRAVTAVARGVLALRDRRWRQPPGFSVARFDDIPADVLASLYRQRVPAEIHTVRDESHYGWRFGNPRWEYTAYVAREGGSPVAGAVVGTRERDGARTTQLADAVPLAGGPPEAWRALLATIVAEHDDARLIAAPADPLPAGLLSSFGFLGRRLLGPLASERPLIVRTPNGTDWTAAGLDVRVPENWRLSLGDRDTS
ncbi:GNAT family N-acetyltransferase [Haloglomus litoreum]|uniref:GNAT family N-acetyltransferase n=1 Tax=Haloglomus litoreum TaxID=3034026 RepID=UPI0023E7F2BD|nr:GNAT family N-acetyltransferase [Haloglomus sp. DT116]